MGAGKSKPGPIIESARTVIARRKKESTTIVIDTIDASVNEVANAGSTHADSALAQRPSGIAPASGAEYSPEVLNSMTNWGNYVTTSYYKVGQLATYSASLNFVSSLMPSQPNLETDLNDFTADSQNPTLNGEKIEMASTVRHAEDKLNIKPNKSIPGRLTEDQITQIFSDLRCSSKFSSCFYRICKTHAETSLTT